MQSQRYWIKRAGMVGRDAQHSGKGKMRVVGRVWICKDVMVSDGVRAKVSKTANKLHGCKVVGSLQTTTQKSRLSG